MRALRVFALVASFVLGSSLAFAQPAPNEQKQAADAQLLYDAQNFVAALPLYEDLHQRQPASLVYTERLAMSLIGSAGTHPPAQQQAMLDRARKLLLDAQAAGDKSNLLQVLLEKLSAPSGPAPSGPASPGAAAFQRAENAFSSGKLPEALVAYQQAFAADPKMYEAPLYAGDTEYKQGHYQQADEWYARAAAVDPDRETAYRYWGDNLMRQGNTTLAEDKYIDAIVADPYSRTPRIGLKQWADATGALLAAPPIQLPPRAKIAVTTGENGYITNMKVGIAPSPGTDNPMGPAIMTYDMGEVGWVSGLFRKTFPTEVTYRDSLAEQVQTIRAALAVLKKANLPPDKWDATWKTLDELDTNGMLDCWILLDDPDQGIAQDYAAYRKTHRDQLHAYIAKYDIHPR